LSTKSKDLQLAVWLLEVETYLEGFAGAAGGLTLVHQLMERYWDSLYPTLDDEDEPLAFRIGVLDWVKEKLPRTLRFVPLSDGEEVCKLEQHGKSEKLISLKEEERQEQINGGWPTPAMFQQAMSHASLEFLETSIADIAACQEQLTRLEKLTDERVVLTITSA